MAHKTNAVRLLDQLAIRYELREYEVDPENLAAETVAARIALPPQQVFKMLVARGDRTESAWQWYPATPNSTSKPWRPPRETARFSSFRLGNCRNSLAISVAESPRWQLRRITRSLWTRPSNSSTRFQSPPAFVECKS